MVGRYECRIGKDLEGGCSGLIAALHQDFFAGLKKTTITSVGIVFVLSEVRTEHLPTTLQLDQPAP